MILTLISLAELDGVFRGLYFFSRCGVSGGPELMKEKKHVNTINSYLRAAMLEAVALMHHKMVLC